MPRFTMLDCSALRRSPATVLVSLSDFVETVHHDVLRVGSKFSDDGDHGVDAWR